MPRQLRWGIIFTLMLAATPAITQTEPQWQQPISWTAAKFLSTCQPVLKDLLSQSLTPPATAERGFRDGFCGGAILMAIGLANIYDADKGPKDAFLHVCLPDDINAAGVLVTFSLYMQYNVEDRQKSFPFVLFKSLQLTYPCR